LRGFFHNLFAILFKIRPNILMGKILDEWKNRLVEVLLENSDSFELAILVDFDELGVYLTSTPIANAEYETLIDGGFYKWEKIRVINLFTADDKEDENMEAEIIEKTKQYFKRKKSVNQK